MKLRGLVLLPVACMCSYASAQQVIWKDNPVSGNVVGLTYSSSDWHAAEATAVSLGGHLVTIRNAEEQAWLTSAFGSIWAPPDQRGPWIGLNDEVTEGSWNWTSGEFYTYANWAQYQPDNQNGVEDWVGIAHPNAGLGRWEDRQQFYPARALVEVAQRPPRSWSWTQTTSSTPTPFSGCTGDFNGDGKADLVLDKYGSASIHYAGAAGYESNGINQPIGQVSSVDVDADGDLDIVGLAGSGTSLSGVVVLRQVSGGLGQAQGVLPQWPGGKPFVADVNGDGLPDLVGVQGQTLLVHLGLGACQFAAQPNSTVQLPISAVELRFADLNGDGHPDLVGASCTPGSPSIGALCIAMGMGDGTFQPVGASFGGCGQAIALLDVDADADIDVVQSTNAGLEVWRNTGAFAFQPGPITPSGVWFALSAADLDGDYDDDLICGGPRAACLWNDGSGSFLTGTSMDGTTYISWGAAGDVDGDHRLDMVAVGYAPSSTTGNIYYSLNQCRFDCNLDGIDDFDQLANGSLADCDGNHRPDVCDVSFGVSMDSDGDGLLNQCEPVLLSLSPPSVPSSTGGLVVASLRNVPDGAATLRLGSQAFPVLVAGSQAQVTLPPLAESSSTDVIVSGAVDCVVTGTNQSSQPLAAAMRWNVPDIVEAIPASAPYDAATGVLFRVEDLLATNGMGVARFGSAPPQLAYIVSAGGQKFVSTTAPAQVSPGPVEVRIEIGTETILEQRGFVYLGPGITSLSSMGGFQVGGESLVVGLRDFVPGTPVEVRLGTGTCQGVPTGFLADSSVAVTTPFVAASGPLDLEVVQFPGQPNEKRALTPGAWLAEAPSITSVTPSSAFQGGGESVAVNLRGFMPGASVVVDLGPVGGSSFVSGILTNSSVTLTMPAAPFAGGVDVRVRQAVGTPQEAGATLTAGFVIMGPQVAGIQPTSGPLEGGTTVVVQTSGFQEGAPAQVVLGGKTVVGTVVGSGANQTVTFRTTLATASGPSDVNITQGVFNAVLPAAYTFDAPRVIGYCTPKPTSQGTVPVIGFSGSPGVAAGDFRITLSNALPNKTAQYFYGPATSNFPIYGGTLCVGGSITRGPMSATNAQSAASVPFAVTGLLVGQKRYIQWWFRDPLDPFGRGFSAGLEVEFYN